MGMHNKVVKSTLVWLLASYMIPPTILSVLATRKLYDSSYNPLCFWERLAEKTAWEELREGAAASG